MRKTKMGWTEEQEKAFKAREGNYLISASAGAGKTAVLTERVFSLIHEGTKLSELLVLTFTDLAASQMRDRVREKIIKDGSEEDKKVLPTLDAANIQTYDSFALSIVQKYHYLINRKSNINVLDQALEKLVIKKSVDQIFKNHYDAKDPRILKLIENYCIKTDEELKNLVITICEKSNLYVNRDAYFENYEQTYLNDQRFNDVYDKFYQQFLDKLKEEAYKIHFISDDDLRDNFETFFSRFNNLTVEGLYDALQDKFPRLNKRSIDPEDKQIIANAKNIYEEVKTYLLFSTKEETIAHAKTTSQEILLLIELAQETNKLLDEFKNQQNSYSFADIFKFAMQITALPEVKCELKNKFKYIMIDEYQDTSDLQEIFINGIANNNVYVVGDVKQSIYKFRNANCDIFLNKFNEYSVGNGGTKINLADNFRSRKEVLQEVNNFFSRLIKNETIGIDYLSDHAMNYKNNKYDDLYDPNINYGLKVFRYDRPEDMSKAEYEARLIASDIVKRMKNGFKVMNQDVLEQGSYKHFAIITSTKTEFEIYKKVLNEYKIPVFAQTDKEIRDNDLTLVLENIIKALALLTPEGISSKEFKHAFLSVYRSFLSKRDDNQLEIIMKTTNYDSFETYQILSRIKEKIKGQTLQYTIEAIINEFDIYNKLPSVGNVSGNINLLNHFYETAKKMDQMSYSLIDFQEYFEDLKKFEVEPEMKEYDDTSDSVKLLSIHASKGLQYKICYFPQIEHQINLKEYSKQLLVDQKYGVRITHVESPFPKDFLHYAINYEQKQEQIKETLRTLYVALTRVEEQGIIIIPKPTKSHEDKTQFDLINNIVHYFEFAQYNFPEYEMEMVVPSNEDQVSKYLHHEELIIQDSLAMDQTKLSINHASKQKDDSINEELLVLGNKYHYYLELLDFKTKDTSFIKDEVDRKRINQFIQSDVFKNIHQADICHEYHFYDEVNHTRGIIDLLVKYADHIDIIDFKLSHIDDEAYEKQLSIYQRYISQISDLPIHTYVTGILSGKVKQIN